MSKLASALVFVVAVSAVALVATAAAYFASPAKSPKTSDRNSKRRSSNNLTRPLPEESQAFLPAEATEVDATSDYIIFKYKHASSS
ncbi:hypothetical protein HDU80_010393 [Chytriomyces hyalinus]|nr:hypothetical protein HDU80_010393 [Chytriomyces hyalinus]